MYYIHSDISFCYTPVGMFDPVRLLCIGYCFYIVDGRRKKHKKQYKGVFDLDEFDHKSTHRAEIAALNLALRKFSDNTRVIAYSDVDSIRQKLRVAPKNSVYAEFIDHHKRLDCTVKYIAPNKRSGLYKNCHNVAKQLAKEHGKKILEDLRSD